MIKDLNAIQVENICETIIQATFRDWMHFDMIKGYAKQLN